MWSLYKKNQGDTEQETGEGIFNYTGEKLCPLKFSNNKTQEDVVKEVLDEINKGTKIIFIKGVCGTGKCLEKDTLIFCKPEEDNYFSYHKISSLVNKKGKIISLDNQGNLIESKFKNVRQTGKKQLFKLKTRTGREIITSANHPFLTITKKGVVWNKLEDLDNLSYICLPNKINIINEKENMDNSVLKILGHLISEGKLGDKAGSPKYYQDKSLNPKIRQDYVNALKRVFPDVEIIQKHQTEVTTVFRNMNTTKGTTNKLRILIKKYGLDGKSSLTKFIPKEIFNLPKEKIAIFLQALFSGDGCIYERKIKNEKQTITVEYDTISKRLIQDLSILLTRFGIQHTITKKSFRQIKEYSYRISIANQRQVKKFLTEIGFLGEKQDMARKLFPKLKEHKFTNIDKVPRVIRDYLKDKGYSFNQLNLLVNEEKVKKSKKQGYKEIVKDKTIRFQHIFRQQKIDFLRDHIKKINNKVKDNNLSIICNEQIFWDKIKSIESIKKDITYDLEVENNHNFIANGIIVHNSAIALNIAKHFEKTSIVVPIKSLQRQYEEDYTDNKFILKEDNNQLSISIIKGRNNFPCPFLGGTADAEDLPCKIELREQNSEKLKQYVKQNPYVDEASFQTSSDVRRMSVAPCCPYWSPVLPSEVKSASLKDAKKHEYKSISGEYALFQRKKGCKYYDQYKSYKTADVLIFNAQKYLLETIIGRKPKTDLDIIDECDDFLDSFAAEKSLNLNRLINALSALNPQEQEKRTTIKNIVKIANDLLFDFETDLDLIKNTPAKQLIELIIDNPYLAEDEDANYYNTALEICKSFEKLLDETYISTQQTKNAKLITLVTINLEEQFTELLNTTNNLVLMSGTLHSEQVLKDIFGIDNFKTIEAETKTQGTISKFRTGLEKNCKYANFKSGLVTREDYLRALEACVQNAEPPCLVHIVNFNDLPSELEKAEFNLEKTITREKIQEMQRQDKNNKQVQKFKSGEIDILFTTKCSRGVDFPGEQCKSIILTKYPYPNIQSLFWKILKQQQPHKFLEFYLDKANRELLQKIYRGLRFDQDHILLLSPDSRVLDARLR